MEKILIIAVDYNSNFYSEKLIHSIEKLSDREKIDLHIAFTGDDHLDENLTVYKKHSFNNIGYFPAAKKVFDSIFNIKRYEFVIICNCDIEILTKNLVKILNEKKQLSADVIAPSIIQLNDIEQNPHRICAPSKSTLIKYKIYFINFHLAKIINLLRKRIKPKKRNKATSIIFSPHGAFIILRKSYFEKGGVIDNNFFLYGEEDSIGAICMENNMQVLYEPSIKIKHYESVSTGKSLSKFKWHEQKKAFIYLNNRYTSFQILR